MTKKEISNDVFDALPIEVRESKLTINQKKILNVLFNYSTLDKSIENGSFFISNEQLLKEAELEYPTQLQRVLSFLITNKFIERIAGTRSLKNNTSIASTYKINSNELIEYCVKHPQKPIKKGNVSMGNGVKNVTDVTVIDELRKEIELLKVRINKLEMGNSNGNGNKITNVTTDIDIDPEINKNITNVNNIKPEVIKHEVNIKTYINSDENKNINTETNVITENDNNINIDNSNSNTLKNLNNMKETNNDTNVNNATLSEILEKQALDNYEAFDSSNVVVCDASSIETVNKYPQEEQERYQRLYTKTYGLIKEWYKSHDSVISSRIESNIRVINMMYEDGYISRKQLEASENNLKNYFNKLMDGWLQIIKERHTSFSNKNPQPPRQQNDQMEEAV